MLPAKLVAQSQGATLAEAEQTAFAAGVVAAIGSGIIEAGGAFVWAGCAAGPRGLPCWPL
jgi:hypothetical protein